MSVTSETVEDVVARYVAEEFGMDPEEIALNTRFQDLADDPVHKTNIAMKLEDYFNLGISDEILDRHICTVGNLVNYIVIKLGVPI